jgi:hypothetical protein
VTAAGPGSAASPVSVLRRSLLVWGLGELALGHARAGAAWLVAEVIGLAGVAWLSAGLLTTTWYPLPFVAGSLFLGAWALQAVSSYRRARQLLDPGEALAPRGPAAAVTWLSLPILAWGTAFWLVAASAATPAAVLDRFESAWPDVASGSSTFAASLAADPAGLATEAGAAYAALQAACRSGQLTADCATSPENLLRDVRISIVHEDATSATALVEIVSFERRPSSFLGIFSATDLVPVPQETLLRIELDAVPAALPGGLRLGARTWQILNATST